MFYETPSALPLTGFLTSPEKRDLGSRLPAGSRSLAPSRCDHPSPASSSPRFVGAPQYAENEGGVSHRWKRRQFGVGSASVDRAEASVGAGVLAGTAWLSW